MPSLRPAKSADIPAVVALIDAAYRHYVPILGRRPRPMDDDQQARLDNGELFVIDDGGTLLAVLTMTVQPEAVHIFNLAVHPDAQGRGLLRQLLGFAESTARREGKSSHEHQQEQKSKGASSTLPSVIEATGDGSEICAEGRHRSQDVLGLFEKSRQFVGNHIARGRRLRRGRSRRRKDSLVLQLDDQSLADGIDHGVELILRHARRQGRRRLPLDGDNSSNKQDHCQRDEA